MIVSVELLARSHLINSHGFSNFCQLSVGSTLPSLLVIEFLDLSLDSIKRVTNGYVYVLMGMLIVLFVIHHDIVIG